MSVTTGATISIRLLGHPQLAVDGRPIRLATRNALLLVARLAVEGPQTRELLQGLLWPDADEGRAQANLRRTLVYVRNGFGRDVPAIEAAGAALALSGSVEADVDAVRRALAAEPSDPDEVARAAGLWRGDFLQGISVEGEELDAWIARQREGWSQRLALLSGRAIEHRSRAGDAAGALEIAERWLARDPLAEQAHVERVRLHLARGDRTAALAAHRHAVQILERELGIEPSPELRELGRTALVARPSQEVAPPTVEPEAPMVGRAQEHSTLAAALDRASAGVPELVLVDGEAGIGKSRLVEEFGRWAQGRGVTVVPVVGFASGRRLAYEALRPGLGEALFSGRRSPATPDDVQLYRRVTRRLAQLSARAPVLLLVDDLHWLDADSLALLAYAADALGRDRRRLLLVVTVREDQLAARESLRDWAARATRQLGFTALRLGPLTPEDSAALVASWPQPLGVDTRSLVAAAGGRPLALVESLRYIGAGGAPDAVPPRLQLSVAARIDALSRPARRLAEAASVLGRPASSAVLAAVAALSPATASQATDELLLHHVLAGAGAYSFTHEILRQVIYGRLQGEARRNLHARALLALREPGAASAGEMAQHAELAGELESAFELRMAAAADAARMPAYRAAADHFRAAIALRPDAAEAWLGLGRAEELAGRLDQAAETYRTLARRSGERGRPAEEAAALLRLAELAGRDLAAAPPSELLAEAATAASDAEDNLLRAETELADAQILAYRGALGRAQELLASATGRITGSERPELHARCLNLGAFIHQAAGRWSDALVLARRSKAAYGKLGERLMVLDSTGYEAASLVFLGQPDEALQAVRRGLDEARRLGNPWAVCNLSLVQGWALRDSGRWRDALEAARTGVSAAREARFEPLLVLNGALAGRCERELGDAPAALRVHLEMHELASQLDGVAAQAVSEELACDHAAAGDWELAAVAARDSIARWGEMRMFAFLSLWTVAEASLRGGGSFMMPKLPPGDRYRFIEHRTRAVLEPEKAGAHLERARAAAHRLGLVAELAMLG